MKRRRICMIILDIIPFFDGAIFWKCREAWTCEL